MTATTPVPPPLLGTWATLGEPRLTAEIARSGVDWVGLDAQHGHFDDRALRDTMAPRPTPAVPMLVRVAANDAALIGRALDAGADGVVVPLVDSVADAEAAVAASHYPPHGARSWGPLPGSRPVTGPGSDGGTHPVPLCAVMIETAAALDAVEAIAAVPGVDMIFVGPFDLSLALGLHVDDLLAAHAGGEGPLARILHACTLAGIRAGAYAGTPERAVLLAAAGFQWIAATTDAALVSLGVEEMRRRMPGDRDQPAQDSLSAGNAAS
ncbi:HpcH/HpaI aldolase family protein [Arthrobacter sp. MDT1-65]